MKERDKRNKRRMQKVMIQDIMKKRKIYVNIEIKSRERKKQLIEVYGRRGGEELKQKVLYKRTACHTLTMF